MILNWWAVWKVKCQCGRWVYIAIHLQIHLHGPQYVLRTLKLMMNDLSQPDLFPCDSVCGHALCVPDPTSVWREAWRKGGGGTFCNTSVFTDLARPRPPSIIQAGKRLPAVFLSGSCEHAYRSGSLLKRTVGHQVRWLSGPCLTWEGSLFRTWCLLLRQWMETKPTLNNNIWLQDKQTFLQRKEGAFFFRPLGSPEMQNMVRLKSHFPSKPSESSPDVTEL